MTRKSIQSGTHRMASLAQTRARIWPLFKAMGITRVANITGLDCIGIPVVIACRPNARSLSVAQGKGLTLLAAEVSGAMESIESYHAEHIVRPLLLASFRELGLSHRVLDPERLPRSAVGRFSTDLKIHWIEGFDLIRNEPLWVPYEMVHTDFSLPLPADAGCFPLSSNGLASGNHSYEAISHGICELIERDADTLFSFYGERERAARVVRAESVDAPECLALLERFERAGVRVGIWDMTSDVGIAVFRAVIMDEVLNSARPLRPSVGMGCHPSRAVALCRALTEAAQSRLTLISSSRDDLSRDSYAQVDSLELLEQLRSLHTAAGPGERSFQSVPNFESDDLEGDLVWQRECLIRSGFERAVVVDLTKPEFNIPVVRMIVPGLEPSREVAGFRAGPRARSVQERSAA